MPCAFISTEHPIRNSPWPHVLPDQPIQLVYHILDHLHPSDTLVSVRGVRIRDLEMYYFYLEFKFKGYLS